MGHYKDGLGQAQFLHNHASPLPDIFDVSTSIPVFNMEMLRFECPKSEQVRTSQELVPCQGFQNQSGRHTARQGTHWKRSRGETQPCSEGGVHAASRKVPRHSRAWRGTAPLALCRPPRRGVPRSPGPRRRGTECHALDPVGARGGGSVLKAAGRQDQVAAGDKHHA